MYDMSSDGPAKSLKNRGNFTLTNILKSTEEVNLKEGSPKK